MNGINRIKKIGFLVLIILITQNIMIMLGNIEFSNISNAEEIFQYANFEYEVNVETNTIQITKYNGSETEVVIPNTIDEKAVTSIGRLAFYNCSNLTSVTIPEGMISICEYAFKKCSSLISINISASVENIKNMAFEDCSSLARITVSDNNNYYKSIDGVLFNKDVTKIIKYPEGKNDKTEYKIPEGVKCIVECAFEDCTNLSNITIPEGVTDIERSAFINCTNLTSIKVPGSVTTTDNWIFCNCTNLKNVELENGITNLKYGMFQGCNNLTQIEIPESVSYIGGDVFTECYNLQRIDVNKDNQHYASIEGILFNKDKTELIKYPQAKDDREIYEIPEGVIELYDDSFDECTEIDAIKLSKDVSSIEYALSYYNSIESIEVDANNPNFTSIDGILFSKNESELIKYPLARKDTTYNVPEKVTKIARGAFRYCYNLKNIKLPENLTQIDTYAFFGCNSLVDINIPKKITSIEEFTFFECRNLKSLELPENIKSINANAFYNCNSLSSINIPASVESIGKSAFGECNSLKSIEIPESVTEIGEEAFYNCNSLANVKLSSGLTKIANRTFCQCGSLKSITIPEGITCIEYSAFYNCNSLTNLEISSSVETIKSSAFSKCSSLEKIVIPEGIKQLGYDCFSECTSLKDIEYLCHIGFINKDIFKDCVLIRATDKNEIELPEIIKKSLKNGYFLYGGDGIILKNCTVDVANNKLIIDNNVNENEEISLEITQGGLAGLKFKIIKPETIIYSEDLYNNKNEKLWYNHSITAKVMLEDEDYIEKDTVIFEENGYFDFNYKKDGKVKSLRIAVDNIDKKAPTITSVTETRQGKEKQNATLTVNAQDNENGSGLTDEAYSFNHGYKWQKESTKKYTENNVGIIIKVKDKAGNIATYNAINITRLNKLNGDINKDNKVNITDLLLLKRHIIAGTKENWKLTGNKLKIADINTDNKINITDLLLLKRIILLK